MIIVCSRIILTCSLGRRQFWQLLIGNSDPVMDISDHLVSFVLLFYLTAASLFVGLCPAPPESGSKNSGGLSTYRRETSFHEEPT